MKPRISPILRVPFIVAFTLFLGCGEERLDPIFEYQDGIPYCVSQEFYNTEEGSLCLQSGRYRITATWSPLDSGYALSGDTTVLSTGWIPFSFSDHPPIRDTWTNNASMGFLAKKTGEATLEVVFDYLEADYRTESDPMTPPPRDALERNPNARKRISVDLGEWKQFNFSPVPPAWADAAAIHLIKKGKGTVTLSRLRWGRSAFLAAEGEDLENMYKACASDDDCGAALRCAPVPNGEAKSVCTLCNDDKGCDDETVCGVSLFGDTRECVFPGIKSLGDFCAENEECEAGVCCEGRCSACCEDEQCTGDAACAQTGPNAPHQCDPGEGTYAAGAPCYRDADCASAFCDGETAETDTGNCEDAGVASDGDAGDECPASRIRYGTCTEPSETN